MYLFVRIMLNLKLFLMFYYFWSQKEALNPRQFHYFVSKQLLGIVNRWRTVLYTSLCAVLKSLTMIPFRLLLLRSSLEIDRQKIVQSFIKENTYIISIKSLWLKRCNTSYQKTWRKLTNTSDVFSPLGILKDWLNCSMCHAQCRYFTPTPIFFFFFTVFMINVPEYPDIHFKRNRFFPAKKKKSWICTCNLFEEIFTQWLFYIDER